MAKDIDARRLAHQQPNQSPKTVIVAGAGYAGVMAANRLAGKLRGRARVVLVSPGDTLVDRIRLHEAAARGRNVEVRLSALLEPGVERLDARLVGVDAQARRVLLDRAEGCFDLHYDALILALGSRLAQHIPADSRHALALASPNTARALCAELRTLPAGARVAVVGGGLTAIELSAEIAEAHPRLRVELLASELAHGLGTAARAALSRALQAAGVSLRSGARVAALEPDGVRLADGSHERFDVSVLACGLSAAPLGPSFALPRGADGRLSVDAHLRVVGYEDIFAVGDLAAPPAQTVGSGARTTRMACATALPLGAHAADQVVRSFEGRALVPFHFAYAFQCISVGRRQGVIAFVDADDRASGRLITGRTGALVKELVCRFALGSIRLERLLAGLYAWPGKRDALLLPSAATRLQG